MIRSSIVQDYRSVTVVFVVLFRFFLCGLEVQNHFGSLGKNLLSSFSKWEVLWLPLTHYSPLSTSILKSQSEVTNGK